MAETGTNVKGAVFSFLRVLAVALASAVLPFVTAPQSDEVPVRAIVTAVIAATLLTVINYLRPGETRFGPTTPLGHRAGDAGQGGRGQLGMIGLILLVLGLVLAVLGALGVAFGSVYGGAVLAVLGLVLLLVTGP